MLDDFHVRMAAWGERVDNLLLTADGIVKLEVGIRVAERILQKWELADFERPPLLCQKYSHQEIVITVSLIINIYRLLMQYLQSDAGCKHWLRWHDPALKPNTPASLFATGIPGLYRVKQVLEARCA